MGELKGMIQDGRMGSDGQERGRLEMPCKAGDHLDTTYIRLFHKQEDPNLTQILLVFELPNPEFTRVT